MGQVALKSFRLYCKLVIMNYMYFDESWSPPSLFTISTYPVIGIFSGYLYLFEMTRNTVKLCENSRQYQ